MLLKSDREVDDAPVVLVSLWPVVVDSSPSVDELDVSGNVLETAVSESTAVEELMSVWPIVVLSSVVKPTEVAEPKLELPPAEPEEVVLASCCSEDVVRGRSDTDMPVVLAGSVLSEASLLAWLSVAERAVSVTVTVAVSVLVS